MREIKLTRGKIALVDDEDYERLVKFKWHAVYKRNVWYAERCFKKDRIGMHRDVLCLVSGDGKIADHIDGNGLNNQKHNLRVATPSGNSCNSRINTKNSSGYKGVSLSTRDKKWRACVYVNGSGRHVGYFDNIVDAVKARDEAAVKLYGEFAFINRK